MKTINNIIIMKRILIIAALVLAVFLIIRSCGEDESTSGQGGGKCPLCMELMSGQTIMETP